MPAPLLAFTENDHWTPGIGDPTFAGWVTVAAYFIAAALCWQSAMGEWHGAIRERGRRKAFVFWISLSGALFLLGINKQLDLQTWFTLFAKHLALEEGWYESRRGVQASFIALVAAAGLIALGALGWLVRETFRRKALALLGGLFLVCFVLVRASSFHHVDELLGMRFAGLRINWILELGGIALVGAASGRDLRLRRQRTIRSGRE